MKKRVLSLMLVAILLFASVPAFAQENPVVYKETITVTEDGGRYEIGFINVEFKKGTLDSTKTFEVKVYSENGKGYIEFSPDADNFNKKVHIKVKKYEGLIYDKVLNKNIEIDVSPQQILVDHFSRYCYFF
ncbi:MAG: hypothetical protein FH751_10095 [Firmicutes bacterium]|nr:hypothetical protein [Bacillota bacterium]